MPRVYDSAKLKIDCAKCDVLCCVAFKLPYDDYQKPAGVACKNLDADKKLCTIHGDLERRAYDHCTGFDCRGAGVAVSKLFRAMGRTWISDPDVATVEFQTFVIVYYTLLREIYPEAKFEFDVVDKLSAKLRADLQPFTDAALDLLTTERS